MQLHPRGGSVCISCCVLQGCKWKLDSLMVSIHLLPKSLHQIIKDTTKAWQLDGWISTLRFPADGVFSRSLNFQMDSAQTITCLPGYWGRGRQSEKHTEEATTAAADKISVRAISCFIPTGKKLLTFDVYNWIQTDTGTPARSSRADISGKCRPTHQKERLNLTNR